MSTPVVVQGKPVANPAVSAEPTATRPTATITDPSTHGEKQETKCRDPIFAVLLYGNVAAIAAVAAVYGPAAFETDNVNSEEYTGYVYAAMICAVIALLASALALQIMMCIPQFLIKTALIFVTVMTGVWMVISFVSGAIGAGVIGAIFFAIAVCYAFAVWSRIPFATANLVTSCTAIKANWGVIIYAFVFTLLAAGWSILWTIAFAGVFDQTYNCDENNVCSDPNYGYLFLLFVAYFFTHQVLQNSVHVTVAGVLGTWWFSPEDSQHFCSPAVNQSFIRTVTTSFGSICFGSLIVAIIQALEQLAHAARANDDGGIGVCIAECILSCLRQIVEYFNKWAFIYVGLYGYPYLQAGKNVITLFQNRGWEAIIADNLVGNTLLLMSIIVGAIMGCVGLIIERSSDFFENAGGDAKAVAFFFGFLVGLVICSVLMTTIGSGVNAVIVLFAEAPAEFQQNYPELSSKMREVWSQVYPGSI